MSRFCKYLVNVQGYDQAESCMSVFFFSKVRKMVHSVGYNFFFFNPSFLFQNNLLFQST